MIDINLLPTRSAISQKEQKVRSKLTLVLTVFSVSVVIILGCLFLINGYLTLNRRSLDDRRAALMSQFNAQQQKASDLRLIKDKLNGVAGIKKSETAFSPILTDLIDLLPPDIFVTRLTVAKDRKIMFAGEAGDVPALDVLIKRLNTGRDSKKYSGIMVKNLNENERQALGFSVEMIHE